MPDPTLGARSEDELMALHFGSVWLEYQSLDAAGRAAALEGLPERVAAAVGQAGADAGAGKELGWSDVAVLRIRVLEQSAVESLRVRAPAIRGELRSLLGETAYRRMYPGVADERTASREDLLAELKQVVTQVAQVAGQGMNHDYFRKGIASWMLRTAAWFAGGGVIVAGFLLGWQQGWTWLGRQLPAIGTAVLAGATGIAGAYVSAQRRMQPLDIQSASFASWFALRQYYNTTKYALALGAVFAALWWLLMVGGVVTSPLLPSFGADLLPVDSRSWALFLVWSFAAGFAERLVLDVLDRFAQAPNIRPASRG